MNSKKSHSKSKVFFPTKKEIDEAVVKSGFPLEIKVAKLMESFKFVVIPNWHFMDRDGKAREIDIVATQVIQSEKLAFTFHILIECKKRRGALVFFETNPPPVTDAIRWENALFFGSPSSVISSSAMGFEKLMKNQKGVIIPKKKKKHISGVETALAFGWSSKYCGSQQICATQYALVHRPDKEGKKPFVADQNTFHPDHITPLMAGYLQYIDRHGGETNDSPVPFLNFCLLLVVSDTKMWSCRVGPSSNILKPIKSTSYFRHFRTERDSVLLRADFLTQDYLKTYIKKTLTEIAEFCEELDEHSEEIFYSANLLYEERHKLQIF